MNGKTGGYPEWMRSGLPRLPLCAVVLAAAILCGCSIKGRGNSRSAPVVSPATASVSQGRLVLSLQIPSATLRAFTPETATATVTNTSDTTSTTFSDVADVTIVDSAGKTIFQLIPTTHPQPTQRTLLPPGAARVHAVRFTVPAPGRYTIEARDLSGGDFPSPVSLGFVSTR